MIRSIHERQYVRGRRLVFPVRRRRVVELGQRDRRWLDEINRFSDNPISAFDFPLRYRLKELCDSYGYSLRRLAEGGTWWRSGPIARSPSSTTTTFAAATRRPSSTTS